MIALATSFTSLMGIDAPIVQAPIGSASTSQLAAAVSNAGGLGMLSITWRSLEETRSAIRQTRMLTDKPFGVNLVLEWDPADRLAIAIEERVPLISLFWGDLSPYVEQIHNAGLLVSHTVGSAAEAVQARDAGVDLIVAQGWEAGGHVWGDVATMPLVPAVVDAVYPLPVLAAGGIADGRGIAAALCLGAAGVWLGTRFLMSAEAPIHPSYRQRIEQANEGDTRYTTLFDGGWPNAALRTLHNRTLENWELAGRPESGKRPGEDEVVAWSADGSAILRYADDLPMIGTTGDVGSMVHYAGQGAGVIHETLPAATIVHNLATETRNVLSRLTPQRQDTGSDGRP